MEYTAIEREDPSFIATTDEVRRAIKMLRAKPALDAGEAAYLEHLLDDYNARTNGRTP